MSDAADYFMDHAVAAATRALENPDGAIRRKQRIIATTYRQLAVDAVCSGLSRLDESGPAQEAPQPIRRKA